MEKIRRGFSSPLFNLVGVLLVLVFLALSQVAANHHDYSTAWTFAIFAVIIAAIFNILTSLRLPQYKRR